MYISIIISIFEVVFVVVPSLLIGYYKLLQAFANILKILNQYGSHNKSLVWLFDSCLFFFLSYDLYSIFDCFYMKSLTIISILLLAFYIYIHSIWVFFINAYHLRSVICYMLIILYSINFVTIDIHTFSNTCLMFVLFISNWLTFILLRYNLVYNTQNPIFKSLIEYLLHLYNNPKLLKCLIISGVITFIFRHLIILSINCVLPVTILLILLASLWLPSMIIAHIVYNKIFCKDKLPLDNIFTNVNLNNYNAFWLILILMQSLKLFFIYLFSYNGQVIKQMDLKSFAKVKGVPVYARFSSPGAAIGCFLLTMGTEKEDPYPAIDHTPRSQIKFGLYKIPDTNWYIHDLYNESGLNYDNFLRIATKDNLIKQLFEKYRNGHYSYVKLRPYYHSKMNFNLNNDINPNIKLYKTDDLDHNTELGDYIADAKSVHSDSERYMYGVINYLLFKLFMKDSDTLLHPQGAGTEGTPDYCLTYRRGSFLFAECKSKSQNFTDMNVQCKYYAHHSTINWHEHKYTFVLMSDQTRLFFALYWPGLHDILKCFRKSLCYKDFFFMDCDKFGNVFFIKQQNTSYAQIQSFEYGHNTVQTFKIYSILRAINDSKDGLVLFYDQKNKVICSEHGVWNKQDYMNRVPSARDLYIDMLKKQQHIRHILDRSLVKFRGDVRFVVKPDGYTYDREERDIF